jgi:hypothetical protein
MEDMDSWTRVGAEVAQGNGYPGVEGSNDTGKGLGLVYRWSVALLN